MARIDVTSLIDTRPMGRFQLGIVGLCIGIAFIDGYDLVAISYAAPALRTELHLNPAALGQIFSAALFGAMLGNFICGPLGDVIGRRRIILANTFLFATFTLLTAFAAEFWSLLTVRFICGFGLGVANVSAYALCAEYSPRRKAATSVMAVTAGYSLGAALGGAIAAYIIPYWGWREVFYLGGGAGLAYAIVLAFLLPESIKFLALRPKQEVRLATILAKIAPEAPPRPADSFVISEVEERGFKVQQLFTSGRALMTVLFWVMCFMNIMELFFVQQWLPTLAQSSGHDISSAVSTGSVLQIGALCGALIYSQILERAVNPFVLLAIGFASGGVTFVLLGQATTSVALMMPMVFLIGLTVPGIQIALNGIITVTYPTSIRSTGTSWAIGVGRLGSVVGPLIAGALLSRNYSISAVLTCAALPASLSTSSAILMLWLLANRQTAPRTTASERTAPSEASR
jgi:MFS transporter, AAHS family, 4-hydroxybenzoate transporter